MKIRTSSLDESTIVLELEIGDEGDLVDMMDERENGFALFGDAVEIPMAVIDGRLISESWFTTDHLLAIEAHELGHIRMMSAEEPVVEREGIRLLMTSGHSEAAEILKDRGIA